MKPSILYGVQFAQSRMLLLSQSGRTAEIDDLLCPEAEVLLDDMGPTGQWRNHLPATQYIRPEDRSGVVRASWTTLGTVASHAEEDGKGPTLRYVVGSYDNEFALHDGVWKFRRLAWRPLLSTTPWRREPDPHLEQHLADRQSWVTVPAGVRGVSDEGVSPRTLLTLELRNSLMGLCHGYNERGLDVLTDADISASAASAARQMLASSGHGASGFILATSPVVHVGEGLLSADVFASVTVIAPRGPGQVEHQRGSLLARYSRSSERDPWLMQELTWYRYATLHPWSVDGPAIVSKGNPRE